MAEEMVSGVGPSHIEMAYERLGDPADPPVLLIMGGGAQLISWPDGFVAGLAGRGLQVIRFDSRDAGRSTHFSGTPEPALAAALAGDCSSVTTGDRGVGQADVSATSGLGPPPGDRLGYIDWQLLAFKVIGSPGFEFDEAGVTDRAGRSWDRDHGPSASAGMLRQSVAVLASGDRTAKLRSLRVPALVIHGDADRMCDPSGGRATAAAIPGAELVMYPGMGHSLPRALWPDFAGRISALVRTRESRSAEVHGTADGNVTSRMGAQ